MAGWLGARLGDVLLFANSALGSALRLLDCFRVDAGGIIISGHGSFWQIERYLDSTRIHVGITNASVG